MEGNKKAPEGERIKEALVNFVLRVLDGEDDTPEKLQILPEIIKITLKMDNFEHQNYEPEGGIPRVIAFSNLQ